MNLDDVRKLGYEVGVAYGGVALEEEALAEARSGAAAEVIEAQTNEVTTATIQDLDAIGRLPEEPEERLNLAQRIAADVIAALTDRADARVAFHERALEIAREMPTTYHVGGFGISAYVSVDDATGEAVDQGNQEIIDSLASPEGHAERVYLFENPEAATAATELAQAGYDVTRPTAGADEWIVDGSSSTGEALVAFAEKAEPKPPAPTAVERLGSVLATAPEIGEKTRAAIQSALAGS